MPALRIKLPNSREMTHMLRGERITIGRSADNMIQISHGSVSSHHAEFVSVDGRYRLHDLQSTNRCFVEGAPVTDCKLNASCRILFGSVECEFDLNAELPARLPAPLPPPTPPKPDTSYLECENRDLHERIHSLQRRFDILSTARLVTGKTDFTPSATAGDSFKMLSTERNELRQENSGLRFQLDRLREELAVTVRERDAARQAAESLQAERASLLTQLNDAELKAEKLRIRYSAPPVKPPTFAPVSAPPPPPGIATKNAPEVPVTPPEPVAPALVKRDPAADLAQLREQVNLVRETLAQLSTLPDDTKLLEQIDGEMKRLLERAVPLGPHAFFGLATGLNELIDDLRQSGRAPTPVLLRTVRQTAEFLARLLEPRLLEAGRQLAPGQVLVIDDDADLLGTVTASLQFAGLNVTGVGSAEQAMLTVQGQTFDTIIADVHLPEMSGPAFCAQARELPAYRKTPVIFLTVADTLDKRAETSLSGGNDFIAKPFNVFELALKVQTWVLRHQLQLI